MRVFDPLFVFHRPAIVGVVNITEDSFSDGGRFLDPAAAREHGLQLWSDGADVVEFGAASSHPRAMAVPSHEEIRRLDDVLSHEDLRAVTVGIDSYQPEVQRFALQRGVAMINDVHGFADARVWPDLANGSCDLVVMHALEGYGLVTSPGIPCGGAMDTVTGFLDGRTQAMLDSGVDPNRIVVDPGMGLFLGKSPTVSVEVLRGIRRLVDGPFRVLVSMSRKSFVRALANCSVSESGPPTLAAELFASLSGVDFIRTHDVAALRAGLDVLSALAAEPAP